MPDPDDAPPRRRRRAVGPPGARPSHEPVVDLPTHDAEQPPVADDGDERLLREVPPHHG